MNTNATTPAVIDFQKEKLTYDFAAWVADRGTMLQRVDTATISNWCEINDKEATQEQQAYMREHYSDYLVPLDEPQRINFSG